MPEFFDIHSHINFPQYDPDRDQVIGRMREKSVWTTTVGVNPESSRAAVEFAEKNEGFFAAIGVHPDDSKEPFVESEFEKLVKSPKVLAIGECGLDYGKENNATDETKARQKKDFEAQIEFAVKHGKPVMIHCRNAYDDVLDILESRKKEYGDKLHAHMHFFAGGLEVLKRCLDNNFTVSYTGVITFVKEYHELVKYTPLESIMAETDAPFVTPVPRRGTRNEPSFVEYVVLTIAAIREENLADVKKTLVDNAFRVFKPL